MRPLDRRSFIRTGTAALAGAGALVTLPPDWPAASPGGQSGRLAYASSPGFYRFRLGDFTITVPKDGSFHLPTDVLGTNVDADQRSAFFGSRLVGLDQFRLPANPAVIDTGDRLVLVDAGTGAAGDPPPPNGRLPDSLAAAGIEPEAIDLVILTHAHPDHLGGLVDAETGALRFPQAEVVLSDTEHALWTAADVERRVPEWVVEWGITAVNQRVLPALGDRVRTIPMEGEVITGIHTIPTPGHTPGHIGVLVTSGAQQLLLIGDAMFTPHAHIERPDWHVAIDMEPELAARTRRNLLDRITADRLLVQGFHLPFPGVGRAVREGGTFRWVPTA